MRIVNKKTFMEMPNGTLYSDVKYGNIVGLKIKEETLEYDFYYMPLIGNIDTEDDYMQYLLQRIDDGKQFTLDFIYSERDGMYDDDALFAIYDQEDIRLLIKSLIDVYSILTGEKQPIISK